MNTSTPSALTGPTTEFFTCSAGRINQTSNGTTEQVETLPADFYNLLLKQSSHDRKVQRGLDKLKVKGETQRVHQYYDCNYSSFDNYSDLSECRTKLGPREYVPCQNREKCVAHGLVCRIPGNLTVKGVQIAKRIALGQMDAQICAELFISQDTLRSHKNNIESKIGGKGKIAIGVWAVENRII